MLCKGCGVSWQGFPGCERNWSKQRGASQDMRFSYKGKLKTGTAFLEPLIEIALLLE